MKAQDIMQALNYLDDEFIVDAQKLADSKKGNVVPLAANVIEPKAAKPKNKARRIALISSITAAAAMLVLVGGVYFMTQNNGRLDKDENRSSVRRAEKSGFVVSEESQSTTKDDSSAKLSSDGLSSEDEEREDAADSEDFESGSDSVSSGSISIKPINAFMADDLNYPDIFEINGVKYKVDLNAVDVSSLGDEFFRNMKGTLVFYPYTYTDEHIAIAKVNADGNITEFLKANKVE